MSTPCTVIIGAPELLDALRESTASTGEVLTFSDDEPLRAIEAITTRCPTVIALERLFAATSRGAALINRIKADPALTGAEIRVVSIDGTYRVSPRRTPAPPPPLDPSPPLASPAPVVVVVDMAVEEVASESDEQPQTPSQPPAQNLDYHGTRCVPRFRMTDGVEVQIEGTLARVVDLSTRGAQILCPVALKPQQRVRMALVDDLGNVKFSATVAWAFFEIPKGQSARYRAGIEFRDAEPKSVDAFCRRHKA